LPNEPQWLSSEVVIDINQDAVELTGEPHFVRDPGLLEGTLARPRNALAYGHEDIVALAVRLMSGIAMAHAFEQGNKRTAFIAMVQFLIENGLDVAIEDTLPWAERVIALIEHRMSEEEFASVLQPFVVPRS
jgi:death on curing protein